MVPDGVSPNDSPDICQVIEAGFLENTSPDLYRQSASDKFLKHVEPFLTDKLVYQSLEEILEDKLKEDLAYYEKNCWTDRAIFNSNRPIMGNRMEQTSLLNDGAWDINTFKKIYPVDRLYMGQMASVVRAKLEKLGLPKKSIYSSDYFEVNAIIGGFYRMCLATEMSTRIGLPLVTDAPQFETCGEYLSFGQPTNAQQGELPEGQLPGVLLKLGIEFPTPESLEPISIKDILKFRKQHKDERKRFRQAIESITTTANTLSDPNQLKDFFAYHGEEIKSAIEAHRRVLDELNVKSFTSLLSVSTPTAIATAAGLTVPPVAVALTGMGIGISLVNWWAEVRKERREKTQDSPWHYLLSVKRLT
jgi:hypothetical protein